MEAKWREIMVAELGLVNYVCDLPMAQVTSFRIGGPADLFVEPDTTDELEKIIEYCRNKNISWFFLGRGSNLLVRDKGIRGVVIRLGKGFSYAEVKGCVIKAGAATPLSAAAEVAAKNSLSGLEFASGIPGSLGGAIFMNAGAYEGEMKQVVKEARIYCPGQGVKALGKEDLCFGYRCSALQQGNQIALEVLMELNYDDEQKIRERMADYNNRRKTKQPLELPSAGSVFKRPEGFYVGSLIQEAGLKGARVGDAQISKKHAGFIVNIGTATAADVLKLIELVRKEVDNKFGVKLEPELRVVGEE